MKVNKQMVVPDTPPEPWFYITLSKSEAYNLVNFLEYFTHKGERYSSDSRELLEELKSLGADK